MVADWAPRDGESIPEPRLQEEVMMADRRGQKKVGRSIKEKRADRKARQDASTQMERLTSGRKG